MNTLKLIVQAIRKFLVITALVSLVLPPSIYMTNTNRVQDEVEEQQDGDAGNSNGKGHKDPCLDPQPPGNAYGLDKKCGPKESSGGVARGDFNNDGFGDLAIGVPFEDFGSATNAGAVHVIYGSDNGVRGTDPNVPANQFWTQDTPGVLDFAEANDQFGSALASGDFNDDGFSDLAIGVPGEVFAGAAGTGIVQVLRGSPIGLIAPGNQAFPNLFEGSRAGDTTLSGSRFGNSLVWADFNGDSFGDLAVEVHANNATTFIAAAVVLFGSTAGLQGTGREQLDFPNSAIGGETPFFADVMLAAGDFNGDGRDDLAVGVPFFNAGNVVDSGAVIILPGTTNGLALPSLLFTQNVTGIPDSAEADDNFGDALAVGDFNGDGFKDLAIGIPGEDLNDSSGVNRVNAGAVSVIRGSAIGLTVTAVQFWFQNIPGAPGGIEAGDGFGDALAAGDFNGDGFRDLAIGVPGEDLGAATNIGAVNVIYGSASDLSVTGGPGAQFWFQDSAGIEGDAEAGDQFGAALTAWDFGRGSQTDLAIGVPLEDLFNSTGILVRDAGAVNVIYGSASGLAAPGNHLLFQGMNGVILGTFEAGDQFGRSLY